MSKHTQGPWVLKHISGSNFAVQRFEIRSGSGMPHPIFNKDTNAIDGTSVCMSPHDARLIAAAPDLLALLEEARRTFEMWKDVAPAISLCEDIDKAIARAKA